MWYISRYYWNHLLGFVATALKILSCTNCHHTKITKRKLFTCVIADLKAKEIKCSVNQIKWWWWWRLIALTCAVLNLCNFIDLNSRFPNDIFGLNTNGASWLVHSFCFSSNFTRTISLVLFRGERVWNYKNLLTNCKGRLVNRHGMRLLSINLLFLYFLIGLSSVG